MDDIIYLLTTCANRFLHETGSRGKITPSAKLNCRATIGSVPDAPILN